MTVHLILSDKTSKAKEKVELLCVGLLNNTLPLCNFIEEIQLAKDSIKATCIEALAHVAKQNPKVLSEEILLLLIEHLASKAPRIKWECAQAIGYSISHFPNHSQLAIEYLVANMNHEGTVVRWSTAFALGKILKLNQSTAPFLSSLLKDQLEKEEKKSIQKIYQQALGNATQS